MKSCDFTAGVGESHFARYAGTYKLRFSDLSNENGTAMNPRKIRESSFETKEFRTATIIHRHVESSDEAGILFGSYHLPAVQVSGRLNACLVGKQ